MKTLGLEIGVARGSPIEVAGVWDARLGHLQDAEIVKRVLLSDSAHWKRNRAGKRAGATCQFPESTSLHEAADVFENAWRRHELSLGTLCCVHSLIVKTPEGVGGKLRDGPTVVRLDGQLHFVAPPSAEARSRSKEFVAILAEYLRAGRDMVSAPVLAAEAVAHFTDLHPFADGNGRVGRAIATWLLLRAGYNSRPNLNLDHFCSIYRHEHYLTLRHHERDPWSWHQFFFDAVLTCFLPPGSE